jgi:hypothetical protein
MIDHTRSLGMQSLFVLLKYCQHTSPYDVHHDKVYLLATCAVDCEGLGSEHALISILQYVLKQPRFMLLRLKAEKSNSRRAIVVFTLNAYKNTSTDSFPFLLSID